MSYYNLACADAEEKKLADARVHLQEAFACKGNVIPGEKLPDPTKDDSFLRYRNNKDFWKFLEGCTDEVLALQYFQRKNVRQSRQLGNTPSDDIILVLRAW